jgi:hypothetical protein
VADPRHKRRAEAAPPGIAGSPALKPSRVCCLGLSVSTAEVRCKSPPCRSLHRGSSVGARSCRRLYSRLLLARQITLLHALLALEQALLCLQQLLLRALLPQALRLLRLQLLYALLQPVDALLVLRALPRKDIALPFLRHLLELLRALLPLALRLLRLQLLYALLQPVDALLALHALARKLVALPLVQGLLQLLGALLALADPLLLRWGRAQRGRGARARRCGDSQCSRARGGSHLRRRTRYHGRTLWRRSRRSAGAAGRAIAGGGVGRAMTEGAAGRAAGACGAALLCSWAYAPVLTAITETPRRNAKQPPSGSMIADPWEIVDRSPILTIERRNRFDFVIATLRRRRTGEHTAAISSVCARR